MPEKSRTGVRAWKLFFTLTFWMLGKIPNPDPEDLAEAAIKKRQRRKQVRMALHFCPKQFLTVLIRA
jgi:hypothetical protein